MTGRPDRDEHDDADLGAQAFPGGDASTATSGTGRAAPWCDRCGEPAAEGDHPGCRAARELEPPRFCPRCRRRMKVQVLPSGWSAVCVEHGTTHG